MRKNKFLIDFLFLIIFVVNLIISIIYCDYYLSVSLNGILFIIYYIYDKLT